MRSAYQLFPVAAASLILAASLPACSSTGIALRERLGIPKREQLVDRVDDAREAQEKAKQQFASTLDEFRAITGIEPGDLEKRYRALANELEDSEDRAKAVRERIADVQRVGAALFKEWEKELDAYEDAALRRRSADQLERTRDRYEQLVAAMERAAATMDPVLARFRDQVLFLKHNLNARALASLEGTVTELEGEIARLIDEMNASIAEAEAFIETMSEAPSA